MSCQGGVPSPPIHFSGSIGAIGRRANSILAVNFNKHRVRMCARQQYPEDAMNRSSFFIFSTIATFVLTTLSIGAGAQQKSLKEQLVGAWTYVNAYNIMSDGKRIEPQGQSGKGMLIMDTGGRFVWTLIRSDLPKFTSNNRQTGTDAENRAVVQGALAYYGAYEVDEAGKSLLMRIEYSSFPNFNGAQQRRSVKLENDELTVINPTGASGGTAYVIWKRVK